MGVLKSKFILIIRIFLFIEVNFICMAYKPLQMDIVYLQRKSKQGTNNNEAWVLRYLLR